MSAARWTIDDAERYLLSLELFGMRFGLDRMRRLMTALGHPERRFDSIHVVGTNGKSSTVRMTAAILARHGHRSGAYLSPHLVSFEERVRIDDHDLEPSAFAAAVARAARAAELVNRSLVGDDRVTQFEALTAAAYSELAERDVEVAVIEAGLGGRYDATNVIPSTVQVLTSVGLEHTRWLGPTVRDIATEKLDVVQPGATLVVGPGLHPDALEVARVVASERGARLLEAGEDPGVAVGAPGAYQRRNFALAEEAARAYLGHLDSEAVAAAAEAVRVPGRLQQVADDPLTLLDGAHNPDGIAALVESLPEITAGKERLVGVVSILDDKDATGMLTRAGARLRCACVHQQSESPSFATADVAVIDGPVGWPGVRSRARAACGADPCARARRARRCCARDRLDLPCGGPNCAGWPSTRVDVVTQS